MFLSPLNLLLIVLLRVKKRYRAISTQ